MAHSTPGSTTPNRAGLSGARQLIGPGVGAALGVAGAVLYMQSLPPQEGSLRERAEQSEFALKSAERRISELERGAGTLRRSKPGQTFRDRARRVAEEIREGKLVDVDDVFDAFKPLMRDLSPLFDRMRARDQKKRLDTLAGEYSRRYQLTQQEQQALKGQLEKIAQESASRFTGVVTAENSSFEDLIRASRDLGRNDEIDAFMERTLQGERLQRFKSDRLTERIERVENEANRKMQRLDALVDLDRAQEDQVYVIMARGSRDFDPSMQFEGLNGNPPALPSEANRNEAILSVLRPEQRGAYENHRRQLRQKTEEELGAIGLKLPENWDVFDEGDL